MLRPRLSTSTRPSVGLYHTGDILATFAIPSAFSAVKTPKNRSFFYRGEALCEAGQRSEGPPAGRSVAPCRGEAEQRRLGSRKSPHNPASWLKNALGGI